jgi:hypothetical protein
MCRRRLVIGAVLALCGASGCAGHRSAGASPLTPEAVVSKIRVGSATQAQVRQVLGAPWRTTNYGETYCGCRHVDSQEVWDYRVHDSSGPYMLHVEFDDAGTVRTLVQVPEGGVARVLASAPEDAHAEYDRSPSQKAPVQ